LSRVVFGMPFWLSPSKACCVSNLAYHTSSPSSTCAASQSIFTKASLQSIRTKHYARHSTVTCASSSRCAMKQRKVKTDIKKQHFQTVSHLCLLLQVCNTHVQLCITREPSVTCRAGVVLLYAVLHTHQVLAHLLTGDEPVAS
jgi:hypothetical protein